MIKFAIAVGNHPRLEFEPKAQWLVSIDNSQALASLLATRKHAIILCAAVWSQYDIQAIREAIDVIQPHAARVGLGVLPFSDFKEIENILPWYDKGDECGRGEALQIGNLKQRIGTERGANPIWIRCRGASPTAARAGLMSAEQILQFAMGHD